MVSIVKSEPVLNGFTLQKGLNVNNVIT